jgi:hypothetical protein
VNLSEEGRTSMVDCQQVQVGYGLNIAVSPARFLK